jgi:hypothetical protein
MGSVSSANLGSNGASANNNGLSNLLQTLTNENSPLLSTLTSPKVESALENAPASDIVQISEQAVQLQATDALFGISNTSATSTDSLFSALADIGSGSSATAEQLAAYQGSLQTQETDALFGATPTATPPATPNPLLDVLG